MPGFLAIGAFKTNTKLPARCGKPADILLVLDDRMVPWRRDSGVRCTADGVWTPASTAEVNMEGSASKGLLCTQTHPPLLHDP